MIWAVLLLFAACHSVSGDTASEVTVEQLHDAIAKGVLATDSIAGTGGSTGRVIEGYLVNRSSADLHVSVYLDVPVYLANQGDGQNMVATQVYGCGRSYLSDGARGFIRVPGSSRMPVEFVAFCVDFDKPNPTSADLFNVAEMPAGIRDVVRSIAEAGRANPSNDLTFAAQLALWVSQDKSLEDIRERFEFSQSDVDWMRHILQSDARQ